MPADRTVTITEGGQAPPVLHITATVANASELMALCTMLGKLGVALWPAETGSTRQDAPRPSSRDVSTGDEPSPEAAPQGEASPAGTGAGTPAGREGHNQKGGGHADAAVADDTVGSPPPATSLSGQHVADDPIDHFAIPERFVRKSGA